MSNQSVFLSNVELRKGLGIYYILDGIAYDGSFPVSWAQDHPFRTIHRLNTETQLFEIVDRYQSGPNTCAKCKVEGMINGVFAHYCKVCSIHKYEFELHRIEICKKDKSKIGYFADAST